MSQLDALLCMNHRVALILDTNYNTFFNWLEAYTNQHPYKPFRANNRWVVFRPQDRLLWLPDSNGSLDVLKRMLWMLDEKVVREAANQVLESPDETGGVAALIGAWYLDDANGSRPHSLFVALQFRVWPLDQEPIAVLADCFSPYPEIVRHYLDLLEAIQARWPEAGEPVAGYRHTLEQAGFAPTALLAAPDAVVDTASRSADAQAPMTGEELYLAQLIREKRQKLLHIDQLATDEAIARLLAESPGGEAYSRETVVKIRNKARQLGLADV